MCTTAVAACTREANVQVIQAARSAAGACLPHQGWLCQLLQQVRLGASSATLPPLLGCKLQVCCGPCCLDWWRAPCAILVCQCVQTANPRRQWLRTPLLPRCRYVETARLKQEKAAGWPLVNKVSPASAGMLTARTAYRPHVAKPVQCSCALPATAVRACLKRHD